MFYDSVVCGSFVDQVNDKKRILKCRPVSYIIIYLLLLLLSTMVVEKLESYHIVLIDCISIYVSINRITSPRDDNWSWMVLLDIVINFVD